jgi:hypothetical protein
VGAIPIGPRAAHTRLKPKKKESPEEARNRSGLPGFVNRPTSGTTGEVHIPLPKAHPETWERLRVIQKIERHIPGLVDPEEHMDRRARLARLPLRALKKAAQRLERKLEKGAN